ncbi:MAG: hypothetical protein Q8Q49_06555 [bacterium]|nr:hypothetical protein [bacterium]
MRSLFKKELLQTTLVVLLIGFFGIFYWQTIMSLPLFGDATIHGTNAQQLLEGGVTKLGAEYPGFYAYLMAEFYVFFGEKGYNLVPFISFLFLLLSVFLFIRQLTKNYYLSLFSIVFVGCSPKIIYYSARMYQEILLSALFIFFVFLLAKYLETREKSTLILCSFLLGILLSLKQQGLFIMYSSTIIYFFIQLLRGKFSKLSFLCISVFPLILGLGFYGLLFHNKGQLIPGGEEFSLIKNINEYGKKIFFFDSKSNLSAEFNAFTTKINIKSAPNETDTLIRSFRKINEDYSLQVHSRAESKHIWPTEVFLDFDKFNQANNLYLLELQGKKLESQIVFYFSFALLIIGFLYCLKNYKKYSNLLLFSAIFLPINYVLFARNNDQQRYHIFLPLFLLSFIFIALHQMYKKITINTSLKSLSATFLSILFFLPLLIPRIQINTLWVNSQIYSPSEGGIHSVQEAGDWIMKNTEKSSVIGQQCGNETKYYSQREVLGDWRTDFLSKQDLLSFFKRFNIEYYVIYKSQLVEEKNWINICWIPYSFFERMNTNFPKVYTTKKEDIFVYRTQ